MEEEGQMSSLGYFSKVEPADVHKSPSVDEFGLNIQRSTCKFFVSYHLFSKTTQGKKHKKEKEKQQGKTYNTIISASGKFFV